MSRDKIQLGDKYFDSESMDALLFTLFCCNQDEGGLSRISISAIFSRWNGPFLLSRFGETENYIKIEKLHHLLFHFRPKQRQGDEVKAQFFAIGILFILTVLH